MTIIKSVLLVFFIALAIIILSIVLAMLIIETEEDKRFNEIKECVLDNKDIPEWKVKKEYYNTEEEYQKIINYLSENNYKLVDNMVTEEVIIYGVSKAYFIKKVEYKLYTSSCAFFKITKEEYDKYKKQIGKHVLLTYCNRSVYRKVENKEEN